LIGWDVPKFLSDFEGVVVVFEFVVNVGGDVLLGLVVDVEDDAEFGV
jgi:hypothetical protein